MTSAIQVSHARLDESAIAEATQCMRHGWVGYGPLCRSLEARFIHSQNDWALATSSCTSALYLAALLIPHQAGDEVIVPASTFISTAMAFHWAGWHIRIADVAPETLLLTPETLRPALNSRTRAVVSVHLYGQKADNNALASLCQTHGCVLVEDAAHRLPLPDDAAPVGQYACYSFNAVKEAPAGEGGLLWCAEPEKEALAREISNVGLPIDTPQRCETPLHRDYEFGLKGGLKLRLNDIAASLALHGLRNLVSTRQQRQNIARNYDLVCQGLAPDILPLKRDFHDDSALMYILRTHEEMRTQLRQTLAKAGISTSVHYPALSSHPLWKNAVCPNAEQASREIITLPLHLALSRTDQQRVIDALHQAHKNFPTNAKQ